MYCFLSAHRVDWGSCSCQHANTWVFSVGVLRGGVDRIWRGHSKLFPQKIKYTSQNLLHDTLTYSWKCACNHPGSLHSTSSRASRSHQGRLSAWRAWRWCLTGDGCRMRVTVFGRFKHKEDEYLKWKTLPAMFPFVAICQAELNHIGCDLSEGVCSQRMTHCVAVSPCYFVL